MLKGKSTNTCNKSRIYNKSWAKAPRFIKVEGDYIL